MAVDKGGDQFARHAAAVARDLFGDPNKALSSKTELRFGTQGSMSVDVGTGQFFDHEQKVGGGVLWAIETYKGATVEGGHAVEWMRQNGYDIEDSRDRYQPPAQQNSRTDAAGNWLPQRVPDGGALTATYDYLNADGDLAYQVCRYDWPVDKSVNPKGHDKTFVQRRPDSSKKHGWDWSTKGMTWLPYRLPELIEDVRRGFEIFIVEGEKKVDMLRAIGVPATCNHGGAGKFPEALVQWFAGAKVVILPDNDPQSVDKKTGTPLTHPDGSPIRPGFDHANLVARRLAGTATSVRILELPNLPPKGGVDDWLPAGGDAEQLYQLAAHAKTAEPTYQSKFGAVLWADFDAPGPSYEYLIKGILTEREVSMLLGESQSGKSFVAIDIAMAVARGIPWFGRQTRRGGVIYQAGESATGVRRRRFPAYRQNFGVASEPLDVVLLEKPVDFYSSDEQVDQFIDECKYWGSRFNDPLKLIIIDTFNKATPGANENDGKDMGMVLARCDRVRVETGAHVMLVHHLNAGGTKARGHTSLFGNVENVVTVRKTDNEDSNKRKVREWILSKAKDGEDGITERFVLPSIQIGIDGDGDKITSCIVARPEGGAPAPDDPNGIFITGFNATILRIIYGAMAEVSVLAPGNLGLARMAQAVEQRELQIYLKSKLAESLSEDEEQPKEGETEDKFKKRIANSRAQNIKRARDYLMAKGVLDHKDGWYWLTGKKVRGFDPAPGRGEAAEERRSRKADSAPAQPTHDDYGDLPFDVDPDHFK